jgi:hypothetical protein
MNREETRERLRNLQAAVLDLADLPEADLSEVEVALRETADRLDELRLRLAKRQAQREALFKGVLADLPEADRRFADLHEVKPRVAVFFDRVDRYHGAGALVMMTGSIGMIVSSCLGLGPLWAGFLAGALPTFLLASLVHPDHA